MTETKNQKMDTRPYRNCVGITLFNREGKVFMGERCDTPGAWQMPHLRSNVNPFGGVILFKLDKILISKLAKVLLSDWVFREGVGDSDLLVDRVTQLLI